MSTHLVEKEDELEQILNTFKNQKGVLITVLQATQELYGFLPEDAMRKISKVLLIPFSEVYGVATFYSQFRLKPLGRNVIKVCSGTACHVKGGTKVIDTIEDELGIISGETTEDLRYSLEKVACLGACGLAPVMMVNDEAYGRLTKEKIKEILGRFQ